MEFFDQLKHPEWQKKRLEVLSLRGFTCQECGATEKQLHVHHPYYRKGKMLWEYPAQDLRCLCDTCHQTAHDLDFIIKVTTGPLSAALKRRIVGYIDAIAGAEQLLEHGPYTIGFSDGGGFNGKD